MTTTITDLDDFKALDPFFRIIEKGLEGIADGPHFFDLLAEKVIFDYIITVPGYPRHVEGRNAVAELYRPYSAMIVLDRCHDADGHRITSGGPATKAETEGRRVRRRHGPTVGSLSSRRGGVAGIALAWPRDLNRTPPRPRVGRSVALGARQVWHRGRRHDAGRYLSHH